MVESFSMKSGCMEVLGDEYVAVAHEHGVKIINIDSGKVVRTVHIEDNMKTSYIKYAGNNQLIVAGQGQMLVFSTV